MGGTLAGGVNPNESVNIPKFSSFHDTTRNFWGVSLMDTMKLGKAQMMLGVHKHESKAVHHPDPTQSGNVKTVKSSDVCPAFGFIYQPTDEVSIMPAIPNSLMQAKKSAAAPFIMQVKS